MNQSHNFYKNLDYRFIELKKETLISSYKEILCRICKNVPIDPVMIIDSESFSETEHIVCSSCFPCTLAHQPINKNVYNLVIKNLEFKHHCSSSNLYIFNYEDMINHFKHDCPSTFFPCQYCPDKSICYKRDELMHHQNNTCPNAPTNCRICYYEFACAAQLLDHGRKACLKNLKKRVKEMVKEN